MLARWWQAGDFTVGWAGIAKLATGLGLLLGVCPAGVSGEITSLFSDQQLAALTPADMAPVTLTPNWYWVNGTPSGDWKNQVPASAAIIHLAGVTDLDALNGKASPPGAEGVLYNRFTAAKDGVAQLGFGADWWLEAFCNGTLCLSTFPEGNGTSLYAADNHPVLVPVKAGENLLTVRVKRGSFSWRFAASVLPFQPPELPLVRLGPWLGDADPFGGTLAIRFTTVGNVGAGVEFRRAGQKDWTAVWDQEHGRIMRRVWHTVRLTGLEPATEYEYRVVLIDPRAPEKRNRVENAAAFTFRTLPKSPESCRFFFTADLQFAPDKQRQILHGLLQAAGAKDCDFLVFGGDTGSEFPSFEKSMVAPVIDDTAKRLPHQPLLVLRGNHELRGGDAQNFGAYFGTADGTAYRLFRVGDTAFLVLDCWEDKPADTPNEADSQYNLDAIAYAEQAAWLKTTLASEVWKTARRHIVFCHGAPYSQYDPCQTMPFMLQRLTDSHFAGKTPAHRIDLWLSGHSHHYARSIPGTDTLAAPFAPPRPDRDGKNYGYPVLTVAGPGTEPKLEASAFRVDITPEAIAVWAFAPNGQCFDQVEYRADGTCRERNELARFKLPGRQ